MKRCRSLDISEMRIKIIMIYHFTATEKATTKKTIAKVSEDMEELDLTLLVKM